TNYANDTNGIIVIGVSVVDFVEARGVGLYALEFGDAAGGYPFDDVDVAGAIPHGGVGGDEFSGHAIGGGQVGIAGFAFDARVVAEVKDQFVVFAEDGEASEEVRHKQFVAALIEVAGMAQVVLG